MPGLNEPFLKKNYSWAIYIDQNDIENSLNYSGSKLTPLTEVRLSLKKNEQHASDTFRKKSQSPVFEELWYCKTNPVGSKLLKSIELRQHDTGVIVVRQIEHKPEQARVAANAILRVLVDLQVKDLSPACVMVPENHYDDISRGIEHYRFAKLTDSMQNSLNGIQLTIKLRSYPGNREDVFCYQK